MSDPHELKALQGRIAKLTAEANALDQERARVAGQAEELRKEINTLKQRIAALTVKEPIVTEHAMLRYIERVMKVDLQQVTNAILTERNRKMIEFAGSGRIKCEGGIEFVFKDRRVVSVVA